MGQSLPSLWNDATIN